MSVPGSSSGVTSRRQKRMGPAPFASFEDLSDELESPDERNTVGCVVRLPGIREDATPTPITQEIDFVGISLVGHQPTMAHNAARLQTPNTPRIDISRASSSSHHDSRDSTPERELFDGGHDPTTTNKLGLGFKEEGALDLRSSTEELDFQDPQEAKKKGKTRAQSPEDTHHQRKDSQSSEIGLLCISGRTSRLSSIGSQGSGHSRLSNASHLSVISGQSGLSRSPSPHKMLLETSFCGTKPPDHAPATAEQTGTKIETDLEKVLLARKQDPTQAVLAEGISVIDKVAPEKPTRNIEKRVQNVKSDITIKVDEPQINVSNNTPNIPKRIISKNGVEYIYIPLKGPLPVDHESEIVKPKVREVKSATIQVKSKQVNVRPKAKSATPSPVTTKKEDEPKYIRIKLKPDYMYSQDDNMQKPDTLDLSPELIKPKEEPPKIDQGISLSSTPSASPKLPRQCYLKDNIGSKTPSPSLSRKSSFASLFRSKEAVVSPESPTVPGCRRKNTITGILREASDSLRDRSRSRSKSRDRDKPATLSTAPSSSESIDSKSKQKSVFSIFKPKKSDGKARPEVEGAGEALPNLEGIAKVEFTFNDSCNKKKYHEMQLEGDSVRIPLHSPTHYEEQTILQDVIKTSNEGSQETVIEVVEKDSIDKMHVTKPELNKRQSSTSSENVVFSTNLGNDNEVFSTKLPKNSQNETTTVGNRNSNASSAPDEDRNSSESERDSEELPKNRKDLDLKLDLEYVEPERKGLVLQQDSYEDDLPYIPTTLPLERSAAVPIVPVRQRSTYEMKTCPIERPRSTTPINPGCLEEYCEEVMGNFDTEAVTKTIEKLKISLPRHDSVEKSVKSPRKPGNTSWFQFAERGISAGRRSSQDEEVAPPPLPPKGVQKEWINFEEIPERRRPPKKIQTLPSRGHIEVSESVSQDNVVYNYVNPEECKCECHEITARERERREKENSAAVQEDELPLLDDETNEDEKPAEVGLDRLKLDVGIADRGSLVSDSSVDLSAIVEPPEANGGVDLTLRTPFTSDLGMSSNRSSILSQDEPESPDSGSPNAFPKTFKPY